MFVLSLLVGAIVIGGGYVVWKNFFGTFSIEELKGYTPLTFTEIPTTYPCAVESSNWKEFFETRYFVISNEEEYMRLSDQLGYERVFIKGLESNRVVDLGNNLLIGVLSPTQDYGGSVEVTIINFGQILHDENKIVIETYITKEDHVKYGLGESLKKPLQLCEYRLLAINKNKLTSGMNIFYFIDENGKKQKIIKEWIN